jgi:hypothetical protein
MKPLRLDLLSLNLLPCCHISFPCIIYFDIKIIHQRIQTIGSHASRCHHCHYCNVSFVLFYNVTYYTNPLFSYIHVNTTYLLNITCTLVATCVIIRRLECNAYNLGNVRKVSNIHFNTISIDWLFIWCLKKMCRSKLVASFDNCHSNTLKHILPTKFKTLYNLKLLQVWGVWGVCFREKANTLTPRIN